MKQASNGIDLHCEIRGDLHRLPHIQYRTASEIQRRIAAFLERREKQQADRG